MRISDIEVEEVEVLVKALSQALLSGMYSDNDKYIMMRLVNQLSDCIE